MVTLNFKATGDLIIMVLGVRFECIMKFECICSGSKITVAVGAMFIVAGVW